MNQLSPTTPVGILLIDRGSAPRKVLRRELERDGYAVLAVGSIGDALARLRVRHFELVVCTDRGGSWSSADDNGLLIDAAGLVARSATGYELYLPGIGIDARAVLLIPTADPRHLRKSVRDVSSRLERARPEHHLARDAGSVPRHRNTV
jgi:ActR/RegA family two-component response regulator